MIKSSGQVTTPWGAQVSPLELTISWVRPSLKEPIFLPYLMDIPNSLRAGPCPGPGPGLAQKSPFSSPISWTSPTALEPGLDRA